MLLLLTMDHLSKAILNPKNIEKKLEIATQTFTAWTLFGQNTKIDFVLISLILKTINWTVYL